MGTVGPAPAVKAAVHEPCLVPAARHLVYNRAQGIGHTGSVAYAHKHVRTRRNAATKREAKGHDGKEWLNLRSMGQHVLCKLL